MKTSPHSINSKLFRDAKFQGSRAKGRRRLIEALSKTIHPDQNDYVWSNGVDAGLEITLADWQDLWEESNKLTALMAATVPVQGTLIHRQAKTKHTSPNSAEIRGWPTDGLIIFSELVKHFLNESLTVSYLPYDHPARIVAKNYRSVYALPCNFNGLDAPLSSWIKVWKSIGVYERFLQVAEGAIHPNLPFISRREISGGYRLSFMPMQGQLLAGDEPGTGPEIQIGLQNRHGSVRAYTVGHLIESIDRVFGIDLRESQWAGISITPHELVYGHGLGCCYLSPQDTLTQKAKKETPSLMPGLIDRRKDSEVGTLVIPVTRFNRILSEKLNQVFVSLSLLNETELPRSVDSYAKFRDAKLLTAHLTRQKPYLFEVTPEQVKGLACGTEHRITIGSLLQEIDLAVRGLPSSETRTTTLWLGRTRKTLRLLTRLVQSLHQANMSRGDRRKLIGGLLVDCITGYTSSLAYRYQLALTSQTEYRAAIIPLWFGEEAEPNKNTMSVFVTPELSHALATDSAVIALTARVLGVSTHDMEEFVTSVREALSTYGLTQGSAFRHQTSIKNFASRNNSGSYALPLNSRAPYSTAKERSNEK